MHKIRNIVDYDWRCHRLAYELLYCVKFDLFSLFDLLLTATQVHRDKMALLFEKMYKISLRDALIKKFKIMDDIPNQCIKDTLLA